MYTSYFVDTENVSSTILSGMKLLDKSDKVYLFYSKNSAKISYEVYKEIINVKCSIEFVESTIVAPNALDFELVAFIGMKVGSYKKKVNKHKYCIISNDKGYDSSINYMKNSNIDICRQNAFFMEELEEKNEDTFGLDELHFELVKDCIRKSKDLQSLHIRLNQHKDPIIKNNYLEIYKQIRKNFKKLKAEYC